MLDAGVMERLDPRDPADVWQRRLHEAGLFVEVHEPSPERARLGGLLDELGVLRAVEDRITRASHPMAWATGDVPPQVWYGMLAVFVAASMVGTALWGMGTLVAVAASPIVLGAAALVGLGYAGVTERRRRIALAAARVARVEAAARLAESAAALLASTWVARGANVVIVSAPHLAWLRARLAELRAARRPGEGPERAACAEALETALEGIEARLRAPSAGLTADELRAPLPDLAARIAALGLDHVTRPVDARLASRLVGR